MTITRRRYVHIRRSPYRNRTKSKISVSKPDKIKDLRTETGQNQRSPHRKRVDNTPAASPAVDVRICVFTVNTIRPFRSRATRRTYRFERPVREHDFRTEGKSTNANDHNPASLRPYPQQQGHPFCVFNAVLEKDHASHSMVRLPHCRPSTASRVLCRRTRLRLISSTLLHCRIFWA